MGWSEFKIYTDKLAELSSIFDELIYLSDKFDIKRLNNFLINIIENHDFYILEDENNEYSDGYSDLEDEYKLSRDILETDEYINMMEYINENFSKMYEQYLLFINKIDSLTAIYLEDLKLVNVDIIKNFSSEYDAVIFNLELLQQKLSYIPNKDKIEETKEKVEKQINININVLLITNNSIMYGIGYKFYKKYLYKNLHVIRKDTYDITYSDEKEFNIKFNNIYSNIYDEFINTLINGKAKNFDENFLVKLKEDIKKYKEKSKNEEDKALLAIDGINKLAKEEEEKDKLNKKKFSEDKERRKEETDQNDDKIEGNERKKQEEEQIKATQNRDNIKEGIEKLKSKKKEEEKDTEEKEEEEEEDNDEVNKKKLKSKAKEEDAKDAEDDEEEAGEEAEKEPEIRVPNREEDPLIDNFINILSQFNNDIKRYPTMGNLSVDVLQRKIYLAYQPWFEKNFPDLKNKIGDIKPLTPSSIQTGPLQPGPPQPGPPHVFLPPGPHPQGFPYPGLTGPPRQGSPLPFGHPQPGLQPPGLQPPGFPPRPSSPPYGFPPPGYPGSPQPVHMQPFSPQPSYPGQPQPGLQPPGFPPRPSSPPYGFPPPGYPGSPQPVHMQPFSPRPDPYLNRNGQPVAYMG